MVYSVAAASARRRIAVMATRQATSQGQKRSMGGGPPPEWEGIDKVVRGVFPQDYQREFLVLQPRTNTVLCALFTIPFDRHVGMNDTAFARL